MHKAKLSEYTGKITLHSLMFSVFQAASPIASLRDGTLQYDVGLRLDKIEPVFIFGCRFIFYLHTLWSTTALMHFPH